MNRTCVVVTLVLNGVECFIERWRNVNTKSKESSHSSLPITILAEALLRVALFLVQWPQSSRMCSSAAAAAAMSFTPHEAFTKKKERTKRTKRNPPRVMAAARANKTMSRGLWTSPAAGRLSCGPGSSRSSGRVGHHAVERESERLSRIMIA
jgi:hypothetical protein